MNLNLKELRVKVKEHRRKDARLTRRLLALCELSKKQQMGRLQDLDYQQVSLEMNISPRTLYRWHAAYLSGGEAKLRARLAPGKKAQKITGWTARLIKEMRLSYNWGAEVIAAHLRSYHGVELGKFVVHRFLKKHKLLKPFKRKSPFNKHRKVVKVDNPGAHTQMDIKHLPYILRTKQKCYVYNFVDHASRWQFKMVFESYGHTETAEFFKELIKKCPFKILRLQTDNGVEFTNKYNSHLDATKAHPLDILCEQNNIKHKLIPVGEKELNGLVERSHRMDDEQLYQTIRPKDLREFRESLKEYCQWTNQHRLRKAIKWLTPEQYIEIWTQNNLASQCKVKTVSFEPDQQAA